MMTKTTKDWTGNPRSYATPNGFHTFTDREREANDYYATNPKAAELLLELDDFDNIWECACGGGHMAKVFKKHLKLNRATDKYNYGYRDQYDEVDFLTVYADFNGDIVTNPPYKYAGEFIEKAMQILKPGRKLALFLPVRYLSSKSRRELFEKYPPYKVWVSSSRKGCDCAINGEFDDFKSSAVDYAWFIWHKGDKGETKLGWFN